MANQVPGFAPSYADLAIGLFTTSEVMPRAQLIAQQACELVPGSGVVVYVLEQAGDAVWVPKATAGDVAFLEPTINLYSGTLGVLAEKKEAVLFSGPELLREEYSHLNVRRSLASLAAIPMLVDDQLVGAMEVLTFDEPIQESVLAGLVELSRLAALGLAAAVAYESERNTQLESITRITQMYDLEKVFNSSLEMDQLLPTITAKFREVMNVQAVNLWLVEGDAVTLMARTGVDNTVETGATQKAGAGMVGDMAETGEPVLIESADDPRLQPRNEGVEEGAIFSLVGAPLMSLGAEVGFVEAINKLDGTPFDEDDLFLLTTINETASNALHNAALLQAERKVEILQTLVSVSQEITSTLNLERVLQTIVNGPQTVMPYERAAIALEERGKLRLSAVSGSREINTSDPQIKRLNELLQWASLSTDQIYVRQREDEIDDPREETRAKFQHYFAESGMRAFYALPLADDQGRVGILSLESSDPDFLSQAHLEMIKVLASQATVALRNAQMYKEVPFIGVIEPLMQKKRQFLAMEKHRRRGITAAAIALVLFLIFCPFPMRLDGDAVVAPQHTAQIQPEVEGVVKAVYVREGDPVQTGTIIADLEDWDYRTALAAAEAKYNTAVAEANRALASNDGTEAGIQRVQADYWASEVARTRRRLERTHLRSPIAGVVATPHIENLLGRKLAAGDTLGEVVDTSRATVDVAIEESDVALLKPDVPASVKLDGFSTRTFRGRVAVVSPKSQAGLEQRVFYARVDVPNPDRIIRAGMQGRGKVWAGWHPAGYVFFRGMAMWIYFKLWSWFGW